LIGNEDALTGIWSSMINSGDVLLKIPNDISGARKIDAEF